MIPSLIKILNRIIREKNNLYRNSLESYLDQYKNDSNAFCIKMMNQLISKTKYLFYLHEAFKSEDAFMNYILYSESYIKSLTLYIDIVSEFKMENLYLFLKNLFVISAVKYDEYSLKIIYKYYLKNINCFNIFGITSCFLGGCLKIMKMICIC